MSNKVRILEAIENDFGNISTHYQLRKDLSMDENEIGELALKLDKHFDVESPEDEVEEWWTIADVICTFEGLI